MQHVAITGSNRGIGLEVVRQLASRPETEIYAMCRKPDVAAELRALSKDSNGRVHLIALEVTDDASIRAAAAAVGTKTDRIDLLINNAAINPPGKTQTLETITSAEMLHVLHVNTVAPLLVVQAFTELLKKGSLPKVVNLSSEMGSLDDRDYGGYYGYCTSKAALNMVTRGLAADLAGYGIVTISLDPGWVQTEMGGDGADLTPEDSVRGILRVVDSLTRKDNGTYLRWNGRTLAW
ncbi:MAG: SDR family oxidoreductase [Chloroflexi bacterium]|nr:SDR family oxidoreductase [Chloroflexota bacterium]